MLFDMRKSSQPDMHCTALKVVHGHEYRAFSLEYGTGAHVQKQSASQGCAVTVQGHPSRPMANLCDHAHNSNLLAGVGQLKEGTA